jgi:hypothetical protein
MTQVRDLIGEKFGRLTIVSRGSNSKDRNVRWNCVCECGGTSLVVARDLVGRGNRPATKSCGCWALEVRRTVNRKHGAAVDPSRRGLYQNWLDIKQRCLNPNMPNYKNYGARGISIVEIWRHDFGAFEEYVLTVMGPKPSGDYYSIDRIDNDGNYEPGNLRWADRFVQRNNQRPVRDATPEERCGAPTVAGSCKTRVKTPGLCWHHHAEVLVTAQEIQAWDLHPPLGLGLVQALEAPSVGDGAAGGLSV